VFLRQPLRVLGLLAVTSVASAAPTTRECIHANEAAQDQRRTGKLVLAHENLLACIAASCPAAIREDCLQRLHEVDAALPKLVFDVTDGSGNALAAVKISDSRGRVLAPRLDGMGIPVDPGSLSLVFEGADGVHAEMTLVVREGEGTRHVPVTLAAVREPPVAVREPPVVTPTAAVPQVPLPPPPPLRDPRDSGRTQRSAGLALGAGGVASFVVGSVFALVAKATYDGAKGCPSACTGAGFQEGQSAYTEAGVATVGFIAGVALLAGGVTLYLTAPKGLGANVSPTVGSGGAGLEVRW